MMFTSQRWNLGVHHLALDHEAARARRHPGQAVFEFMLMLPIFVAIILLVVDFSVWMFAHISVSNAAREGARYAAVRCPPSNTCGDGAAIKTRVVDRDGRIGITTSE